MKFAQEFEGITTIGHVKFTSTNNAASLDIREELIKIGIEERINSEKESK